MVARLGSVKDSASAVRKRPETDAQLEPVTEKFEELLADLSGTFIRTPAENIDDQIELWLQKIVLFLGLDRGTVTQFDDRDGGLYVTHQWARGGISTADRERDVKKYFPWLADKIASDELVVFSNLPYRLPTRAVIDRRFVEVVKVRAHLTVPLKVGGNVIGGLSFATVFRGRSWSKREICRLRLVAEVFGNALGRERVFAERRRHEQDLRKVEGVALAGELAAVLQNELRQPLTAILSNAEVAHDLVGQERPDLIEVRDALADIIRDTARTDEIIRKLNRMFRSKEAERLSVEIDKLLFDIARTARPSARSRGIRFSLQVSDSLPAVLCNKMQVSQAISDLISNAFDAVSEVAAPREVCLLADLVERSWVRVAVRDSGNGLDSITIPRLFEPFFTTKATGTGVGLAIARSIVQNHGGRVWAKQNTDRGATFGIDLPLEVMRQSALAAAKDANYLSPGANALSLDGAKSMIIQEVCNQFGLTRAELFSKSRAARIVFGRMIAMYLSRLITNASFARIGDWFSRDHTTVLYAFRRIERMMAQRPTFQKKLQSMSERVRRRFVA
jgi:signal transduction histidine kinase